MAEISVVSTPVGEAATGPNARFSHGVLLHTWTGVNESDTYEALEDGGGSDVSVHISGSFGGGSAGIEGSNNGTSYVALKDLEGNAIAMTAEGITSIRENVRYIRPSTPTGTSVSLTYAVLSKTVR